MNITFYTTLFTWLNIFLIIVIAVLFVKFMTSGIRYFSSRTKTQQPVTSENKLHDVLREYRVKNNMTQEFVAQSLGVSRQAVSKWENGTSEPSTSNLLAIAQLYGVPAQEILSQIKTQ